MEWQKQMGIRKGDMKTLWTSVLTIWLIAIAQIALSAEVVLSWNAVDNATGYRMYYGTESKGHGDPVDVGAETTGTITLEDGTYFFAVTAYNDYGESAKSQELKATIATPTEPEDPIDVTPPGVPNGISGQVVHIHVHVD